MKLFRWIWTAIKAVLMLAGFAVIGLIVLVLVLQPWERGAPEIAEGTVLDIRWEGRLSEKPVTGNFVQMARGQGLSVYRMSRIIRQAASDNRIAALTVDLSATDLPLAHAEELMEAMQAFSESGKPSYAFSTRWNLSTYMLGTAFTEIWMPESGDFGVGGLKMIVPYARDLADDLGIQAQLEKRKTYKSAADFLTERGMTGSQETANQQLLDRLFGVAMVRIAKNRTELDGDESEAALALQAAFWNPRKALEFGLIDRLAHRIELAEAASGPRLPAAAYVSEAMQNPLDPAATIALIAATGTIREGKANALDTGTITDRNLIEDLLQAERDPNIDAIILRVDSGGGGYAPSDAILQTMAGMEKPLVVSMGQLAGSGGYMIAMTADRIVANPTTITGSIGVIGGKIVIEDLLDEWGVTIETVEAGRFGGINSPLIGYSQPERSMLKTHIDRIYEAFTGAVATHRNMSAVDVEQAAQGRIWTGLHAKSLGLVDELGGIATAIGETVDLLKIPADRRVHVVEYPELPGRQRIANAIGLQLQRVDTGLGWLQSPENALKKLEDKGGIRTEMHAFQIR